MFKASLTISIVRPSCQWDSVSFVFRTMRWTRRISPQPERIREHDGIITNIGVEISATGDTCGIFLSPPPAALVVVSVSIKTDAWSLGTFASAVREACRLRYRARLIAPVQAILS